MLFEERFRSIFTSVEVELACSLPVCNIKNEIIFFYSTKPNNEFSYKFGNVEYIFSRDIVSGLIEKILPNDEKKKVIETCIDKVIWPTVIDDEAYDAEDRYFEKYELFYNMVSGNRINLNSDLCKSLLREFNILVPEGGFRSLYYVLGKEYFDMLK